MLQCAVIPPQDGITHKAGKLIHSAIDKVASLRRFTTPMFFAVGIFYLSFHSLSGDRGLYAWFKETHRLETLKADLDTSRSQRESLERKVKLMNSASLDLDMLDEQARRMLGGSKPDFRVMMMVV